MQSLHAYAASYIVLQQPHHCIFKMQRDVAFMLCCLVPAALPAACGRIVGLRHAALFAVCYFETPCFMHSRLAEYYTPLVGASAPAHLPPWHWHSIHASCLLGLSHWHHLLWACCSATECTGLRMCHGRSGCFKACQTLAFALFSLFASYTAATSAMWGANYRRIGQRKQQRSLL